MSKVREPKFPQIALGAVGIAALALGFFILVGLGLLIPAWVVDYD